MIIPLLLYFLMTVDAMFSGYRCAAGRNAAIYKRKYFQRYMLIGVIVGQMIAIVIGVSIAIIWFTGADKDFIKNALVAGYWLLVVYIPYTGIIFLAFLLRLIPSVDMRSITSVVVFGPFTVLRPFVACVGVFLAVLQTKDLIILAFCVVILLWMLLLERFLGWLCFAN